MILLLLEIIGWVFASMLTGALILYNFGEEIHDDGVAQFFSVILALAWPLAVAFAIGSGFGVLLYWMVQRLAYTLGAIHNRGKVNAARVQMLEHDLGRVGGSLELALRYEYQMCHTCYGKGCGHCHNMGVQRVKV